MSMYARERRRQEQLPHGRENVYQYCDTEPQPMEGAPRWRCRPGLDGEADGPNGGSPARLSATGSGRAWRQRGDVLPVVELLVGDTSPTGTAREWSRQIRIDTREAA